ELGLPALGLDLLRRAKAAIRLGRCEELRGLFLVYVEPFRLPDRALFPVEPEPPQAFIDEQLVLRPIALHVGIVDAQHERALALAGEENVVEGGAGGAEVCEPGRAGRDPDTN